MHRLIMTECTSFKSVFNRFQLLSFSIYFHFTQCPSYSNQDLNNIYISYISIYIYIYIYICITPGTFNCHPFLIRRHLFNKDEQQSVVALYIKVCCLNSSWGLIIVESSSKSRNLHFSSLHFLIKNKLLFI